MPVPIESFGERFHSIFARVRSWRLLKLLLTGFFTVALIGMIAWGSLAIYFSNLVPSLRLVTAAAFAGASVALLRRPPPSRRRLLIFLGAFAVLVAWWLTIPPSNVRDWQPDVAVLPWAEINGNKVTLHNVRDCRYRTESDFDVRHHDRTLDLRQLGTIDLFLSYWGAKSIAHTMLSFGFGDEDPVCISIETRKELGESYSALKGIFKQYELTYVVAEERDVVRLRTNYRDEQVYLYRLQTKPELIRAVFLDYLASVNSLSQKAEWYNALTSNCTTNIRGHMRPYVGETHWDWRVLFNGHIDELAYKRGALDQSLPFAELKARAHINERARAADPLSFSKHIRNDQQ